MDKNKNCDICHNPLENEWGNNAWPVLPDGTCCNTCNNDVIWVRMAQTMSKFSKMDILGMCDEILVRGHENLLVDVQGDK